MCDSGTAVSATSTLNISGVSKPFVFVYCLNKVFTVELFIMSRYDLNTLQSDLRRELGNGLTEESVELVKGLMSRYKSDPRDWKDKEKWSDVK